MATTLQNTMESDDSVSQSNFSVELGSRRVPGSGESLSCSVLFISIVKLEANVFTTS